VPSSKDPIINRQKANEYRLAHPEWHRRTNREWLRKKRAGMSVSERQQKHLRDKQANPQRYLWQHAKTRAKQQDLPFDLAPEDIVIPEVCPVFGVKLEWGVGNRGWRNLWSPSLDKIKPELGYVRGNVMVISNRANHLKSNGSIDEFEAVLAYMRTVGAHQRRRITDVPVKEMWAAAGDQYPDLFSRIGW
jgi:hypothetical protein